ncbi:MAG: hypothetical protein ACOCP8_00715 [archaeon]
MSTWKWKNKYVFILCPPKCGSGLIWNLLKNKKYVSFINSETIHLPEIKPLLTNNELWNQNKEINLKKIKSILIKNYFNFDKTILLQKSTPDLIRAEKIEKIFKPSYFIISIRNPYAMIESNIRWANDRSKIEEKTRLWVKCAKFQKNNLKILKNTLFFKYEDLTDNYVEIKKEIKQFLPELKSLRKEEIKNCNYKINNLSKDEINLINCILEEDKDILEYFNYKLINP